MKNLPLIFFLSLMFSSRIVAQDSHKVAPLILVEDSTVGEYGYKNAAGKIVIPLGKYATCYTDTFRNYAIVWQSGKGIVAIDRQCRVLYEVFVFDNGPDAPVDGLFRIISRGKIGYADATTGEVIISPKYACAWPFERRIAKVSLNCQTRRNGEHSYWTSDDWFYINKVGARVPRPKKY
jgi:hypothetical protein